MISILKTKLKDARDFQIIFLSLFLLYGIWFLSWDVNLYAYGTILISCLIAQFLGVKIFKIPMHSIKSAIITAVMPVTFSVMSGPVQARPLCR